MWVGIKVYCIEMYLLIKWDDYKSWINYKPYKEIGLNTGYWNGKYDNLKINSSSHCKGMFGVCKS